MASQSSQDKNPGFLAWPTRSHPNDLPMSPNSILFFHTQAHSCLRDFVLPFPWPTELLPHPPHAWLHQLQRQMQLLVTPSKAGSPEILNIPLWLFSPYHSITVIFLCITHFMFVLFFTVFPFFPL